MILIRLHDWLQGQGVEAIAATAQHLQQYQVYLSGDYRSPAGKPLARSTLSTHIAVIKGWYRWLAIKGRIVADPSRRLESRYVRSRVVVRNPLSLQEATALVQTQAAAIPAAKAGTHTQAIAIRNLAIICIALATGRRIGGITTLRVVDLDLERRELRVEREKGRAGRVLPVAGWAVDVVATYLRDARPMLSRGHDAPWLFLSGPGNGPITRESLRWTLEELLKRTIRDNPDLDELPRKRLSWHSLRVSFATLLFSNGCDIRSVNELLLHQSLSTTSRYTPVPIDDLRQVFRTAHPRP
jgi:site-specific recombinase XerD